MTQTKKHETADKWTWSYLYGGPVDRRGSWRGSMEEEGRAQAQGGWRGDTVTGHQINRETWHGNGAGKKERGWNKSKRPMGTWWNTQVAFSVHTSVAAEGWKLFSLEMIWKHSLSMEVTVNDYNLWISELGTHLTVHLFGINTVLLSLFWKSSLTSISLGLTSLSVSANESVWGAGLKTAAALTWTWS